MSELYLEAVGIRKAFGLRTVLNFDRFELRDGDRVGLVGENGAGKSTLIRVLSGQMVPDEGQVRRAKPVSVISQLDDGASLGEADPATSAQFRTQPDREGLSGGEKTRRRIARALSAPAHVLLADEPTSDLDAEGIELLEKRLLSFRGALLLVSHDRQLLDALCTAICQLEDGRLTLFPGNYQAYLEERARRRAFQQFEYDQYRREQARLTSAIQGKREHASRVISLPSRMGNSEARLHKRSATEVEEKLHKTRKALESRLSQLEEKTRPRQDPAIRMALGAFTPVGSRVALEVRDMTLRVGGRVLLSGASLKLPTGSRTALMGPNGCGKTSLIARIARGGDPRIRLSPGVKPGWFLQDHAQALALEKSALDNVLATSVHDKTTARTVLARLNLAGDAALKPVSVLSGGERAKVALARLFLSDCNLLVLDEPTNHLDIFSLEALEQVLSEYAGTLLVVSHDRRFVDRVATRISWFEGERLQSFEGTLTQLRAQRGRDQEAERTQLSLAALQMRMAELAARLGKPRKGDDLEALDREYQALACQARALREG